MMLRVLLLLLLMARPRSTALSTPSGDGWHALLQRVVQVHSGGDIVKAAAMLEGKSVTANSTTTAMHRMVA